tara:strand:- start:1761 stop:1889 length:129 start_codon:yes stop_codon:yes gene_type:complete
MFPCDKRSCLKIIGKPSLKKIIIVARRNKGDSDKIIISAMIL